MFYCNTPNLDLNFSLTVLSSLMWQYVAMRLLNISLTTGQYVGNRRSWCKEWISQITQTLYCHLHIIYKQSRIHNHIITLFTTIYVVRVFSACG